MKFNQNELLILTFDDEVRRFVVK